MKVWGQLRHCFWGTYYATIGLFCHDADEAKEVESRLGKPWRIHPDRDDVVLYHGTGEELEVQFSKLESFGADLNKVKSLAKSVDFGERFELEFV